jgi:hypothetical protein
MRHSDKIATSGAPTNSNSVSKSPPLAQRKDPSKTTDVKYVASYKDILCHYDPEKQLLVSYSFKDVKHSVVLRLEDGFRTSAGTVIEMALFRLANHFQTNGQIMIRIFFA